MYKRRSAIWRRPIGSGSPPPPPIPGKNSRRLVESRQTMLDRLGLTLFRQKRKRSFVDWVFIAAGIASLALGVGANAAIFSVTSSLWLRHRGIFQPDKVGTVYFRPAVRDDGALVASATTRECQALRSLQRAVVAFEVLVQTDLSKWMNPRVTLVSGESLSTTAVSYNYFEVLGVNIVGRGFTADDDIADHRVAVVSRRFARSHFPSESAAVGGTISVGRGLVTIVGVAPKEFTGTRLGEHIDLWIPLGAMATYTNVPDTVRGLIPLAPVVRLRRGGEWKDVQAQLDRITDGKAVAFSLADLQYVATSLGAVGRQSQLIKALRLMAALILLATILNLSGLFVARIGSRRHELAVRLALGSSKWKMITVLQRDARILVCAGVPISLITANVVTRSIRHLSLPGGLAVDDLNLSIDWRIAVFGTLLCIVAVGAAAVIPLYRALATEPRDLLTRSVSDGDRKASLSRQWLVAAYVALSVVLTVGAASLVQRIATLRYGNQGLDARSLVVTSITPATEAYLPVSSEGAARVVGDFRLALEKAGSLPGVQAATYGDAPLSTGGTVAPRWLKTSGLSLYLPVVVARGGAGYLDVIGARLVAGRDLVTEDVGAPELEIGARGILKEAPPIGAIVDASLARVLWPRGDAVGQFLSVDNRQCVVVGVMRNVLSDLPVRIRAPMVIVGSQPSGWLGVSLPAILVKKQRADRVSVVDVDKTIRGAFLVGSDVRTQTFSQQLGKVMANERLGVRLFGWLGTASSLMGMIGTYGLATLLVFSRKHEFAVRAALGATLARLRWLCVGRVMVIVLAGTTVGLAVAVGFAHTGEASAVGLGEIKAFSYVAAALFVVVSGAASALAGTAAIRRIDIQGMLNDTM